MVWWTTAGAVLRPLTYAEAAGAVYGASMSSLLLSVASIAIAVLSVGLSYYLGVRNTRASERSAAAAEESRRIAERQLSNAVRAQAAALQPYVWADLRPRDDGQMLVFVVGNAGPTVATDVQVTLVPSLEDIVPEGRRERARLVSNRLSHGLRSIAPGRTFMWNLDVGFAFSSDEDGASGRRCDRDNHCGRAGGAARTRRLRDRTGGSETPSQSCDRRCALGTVAKAHSGCAEGASESRLTIHLRDLDSHSRR